MPAKKKEPLCVCEWLTNCLSPGHTPKCPVHKDAPLLPDLARTIRLAKGKE